MASYNGHTCAVTIVGETLQVSFDDFCISMRPSECEFHRSIDSFELTSADGVLKLTFDEAVALGVWKFSTKGLRPIFKWGVIAFAFICAVLFGPRLIAGPLSKLISVKTERSWLGSAAVADTPESEAMRVLLDEVPSSSDIHIELTHSDDINAFALPGANIQLTKGAICFAKTPDEVVGLLAHEVGHVRLRHSMRSAISGVSVALLSSVFLGGGMPMTIADSIAARSYSVEDETEADQYAAEAMIDAGLPPAALGDFFERLDKDEPIPFESVLSDHPLTKKRVAFFRGKESGRS